MKPTGPLGPLPPPSSSHLLGYLIELLGLRGEALRQARPRPDPGGGAVEGARGAGEARRVGRARRIHLHGSEIQATAHSLSLSHSRPLWIEVASEEGEDETLKVGGDQKEERRERKVTRFWTHFTFSPPPCFFLLLLLPGQVDLSPLLSPFLVCCFLVGGKK